MDSRPCILAIALSTLLVIAGGPLVSAGAVGLSDPICEEKSYFGSGILRRWGDEPAHDRDSPANGQFIDQCNGLQHSDCDRMSTWETTAPGWHVYMDEIPQKDGSCKFDCVVIGSDGAIVDESSSGVIYSPIWDFDGEYTVYWSCSDLLVNGVWVDLGGYLDLQIGTPDGSVDTDDPVYVRWTR